MAIIKNILYHTIQTDHVDEAKSLAYYLNEHGVFANARGDGVELAVPDRDTYDQIATLKSTWQMFWENSDSGLFGLPVYTKT